ncbi:white collar 2 type of transcription factor [Scleroderma citrinum]
MSTHHFIATTQRQSQSKPASSQNSSQIPPATFEFTKRKRWADLLIHELSEAIIFVLSNDAKVWFCGRAISELLGWRDADLIDRNLTDFINTEDQQTFHVAFQESLRTRMEMNSYIRLQCRNGFVLQHTPQSQVLFELKGYPLYIDNESTSRCFFAVAKPFPSRNVAMLNTFLELKIENERLQQRLAELRLHTASPAVPSPGNLVPTGYLRGAPNIRMGATDMSGLYHHSAHYHSSNATYDDMMQQTNQTRGIGYDSQGTHPFRTQYPSSSGMQPEDDIGDDTSRRKKMRKMHGGEQHVCVTCGRTDSPEWRKGPQGPKTLCNACGLRWAKEVRSKGDENSSGTGPTGTSGGAA